MACLPPGFHFDPTDEELIVYFLYRKAANLSCSQLYWPNIIPELDVDHVTDPWELKDKAFLSEREYFYFFSRSKKNRYTKKGIWRVIGNFDEPIFTNNVEIGTKKYLVFYADGAQTNWIMEEYHLTGNSSQDSREIWVLCRVHESNNVNDLHEGGYNYHKSDNSDGVELSCLDEIFYSMDDDQEEITFPN